MAAIQDLLGRPVSHLTVRNPSIPNCVPSWRIVSAPSPKWPKAEQLARSVIAGAEHAVRLLDGHHAACPTCMRSLAHQERASAISLHRAQIADARAEMARLEEARRARQAYAQAVSRLVAQLEALQPPDIQMEDVSSLQPCHGR